MRNMVLSLLIHMPFVTASVSSRLTYTLGVIAVDPSITSDVLARDKSYYEGLLLFKDQLDTIGGIPLEGTAGVHLQYEVTFVIPNTNQTLLAAQAFADNPDIDALTCSPNTDLPMCATVAAAAKMIFLSPYISDEMCSGPTDKWGNDYDYSYCLCLDQNQYAYGIFNEASRLGYTKTAIYWAGYYPEIADAVSGGAVQAATEDYDLDVVYNKSFDNLAASYSADGTLVFDQTIVNMLIEARDAEVELLITLVADDAPYVLQILESIGYTPSLLYVPFTAGMAGWPLWTGEMGNYVTGALMWYYTMSYSDPFFGDTQTYSNEYLAAYGSYPTEWAAVGSLAGVSIALAIQKGGGLTLEKVNRGMGFVNDETFWGLLKYGQFNRNIGREAVTTQWTDGEMEFVLPSSIATAELYSPMVPWVCRDKQQDAVCFDDVVGVTDSSQVAFTVISAFAIGLLLLALVGVFRKQDSVILNRASPLFCKLLIVFGIGGYVSCMLFAIKPTEGNGKVLCPGRIWVLAYASTGVLASLFAKTWRLYRLFTRDKTVRQAITDQQLLGIMAAIFAGTTVLMVGWTADKQHRPHYSIVPHATMDDVGVATCSVDSPWLWANITYFLLLNGWGAFLAWHVRKLPSSFNESKYIFFSLYNIFICIVVLLPIGAVMLKDTVNEDVTLCIGILFAFSSVMLSIIGSKFLLLHYKDHEADYRFDEGRKSVTPHNKLRVSINSLTSNGGSGKPPFSCDSLDPEHSVQAFAVALEHHHGEEFKEGHTHNNHHNGDCIHGSGDTELGSGGGGSSRGGDTVHSPVASNVNVHQVELAEMEKKWKACAQKEVLFMQRIRELEGKVAEYEKKESESLVLRQEARELQNKVAELETLLRE